MLEHGAFTFQINNNIIIFKLTGDFNEYGIKACLEAEKKAIESFGKQPCLLLVDCRAATGATPEAYQAINDFYRDINYAHLSAIALVYSSDLMARIEERSIPLMKNHEAKAFLDWQAAIDWLTTKCSKKT
jgi:hypothetical protein